MDYMRPDIVALLRGSDSSYVRELIGMDPVAVFRWAVLRAAIQAMAVLREAGRLRAERAEKAAATVTFMWNCILLCFLQKGLRRGVFCPQVDGHPGGQKRPAAKQLTKGAL